MRAQKPEELFDQNGKLIAGTEGTRASGSAPDERQSARERWISQESSASAALLPTTPSKLTGPETIEAENVAPLGRSCETS